MLYSNQVRELQEDTSVGVDIKYKYSAVCVAQCPVEEADPVDCALTQQITDEAKCRVVIDDQDPQTFSGHLGYGTYDVFGRVCLPNLNKLPD